jgi:hypothetical protein
VSVPAVWAAVQRAADHDVVVVVGASTNVAIRPLAQLVRVGAMGIDDALGADYAENGVDVIAPGVGVSSVGINGTGDFYGSGTEYAVALVAGQAALIRSAYRSADAAEVVARIRSTATPLDSRPRPSEYSGWGLINIDASIQPAATVPATAAPTVGSGSSPGAPRTVLWVTIIVIALVALMMILRVRWAVRAGRPDDGPPPTRPQTAPPQRGLRAGDGLDEDGVTTLVGSAGFARTQLRERPPAPGRPTVSRSRGTLDLGQARPRRPPADRESAPATGSELGAASSYGQSGGDR